LRPRQARWGQQVLTDLLRTPRPHPPILSTGPITSLFIINCTTVWKNDSARNINLFSSILWRSQQCNQVWRLPPREGVSANLLKYLSLVANHTGCIWSKKGCSEWNNSLLFLAELGAAHCYPQPGSKSNQS
jgi:hypothetical protein